MKTKIVLNGKSYAGNPRVRFDEGDVASAATSRRGSLLYKHSNLVIIAGLVAGLVTGFGHAAEDNPASVNLETPDAFLSYVEATGTQFIDTGVKARGGTKVEASFQYKGYVSSGGHGVFIGADSFRAIAVHSSWYYFGYSGSTKSVWGYVDNNESTGFVCTYADEQGKAVSGDNLVYTCEVTENGACTITVSGSSRGNGTATRAAMGTLSPFSFSSTR